MALLKESGHKVEFSPHSPQSGYKDKRWENWYTHGLPQAINEADLFIAVITPTCDGSSWMMQEYQEAYSSFIRSGKPTLYFIRFDSTEYPIKYQEYYLQNSISLPADPQKAVQLIQENLRTK